MKRLIGLAALSLALMGCQKDPMETAHDDAAKQAESVVVVCLNTNGGSLFGTNTSVSQLDVAALYQMPGWRVVSRKEIYRGGTKRYSGKQNVFSGEDGAFVICYEVTIRNGK